MRIVAGRHKGRVLAAPDGRDTRPTADRVRESLFNILAHGVPELEGAVVLDAFAGSGALGFEALSRGAGHVTFLETDASAFAIIYANAKTLGEDKKVSVQRIDATRPPVARTPCQIILMDPPYKSGQATPALLPCTRKDGSRPTPWWSSRSPPARPSTPRSKASRSATSANMARARLVFLRFEPLAPSPATE